MSKGKGSGSSSSGDMKGMLFRAGAALVGGAVLGMAVSGANFSDVLTSMEGAAGATVGYIAAGYVVKAGSAHAGEENMAIQFAGAVAVPAVMGGKIDVTLFAIAAGTVIGPMIVASVN